MKFRLLILTIVLSVFICIVGYADDGFILHTIYFQATDAPNISQVNDKISNAVKSAQNLFADEMERHGYGRKTFEADIKDGVLNIHHVKGKHNASYYVNDTYNKVQLEIPDKFNHDTQPSDKRDDIHLIVMGGVNVMDGWVWGYGWPFSGGRFGGGAIATMEALKEGSTIIA